jgi:serine/threonine-protein kinase
LALAAVRLIEQDLEAAAKMLKQSLDRAPHLAEAHELLAELLLEVGDLEESISRFRTALTLDPELRCGFLMARALAYLGRWDEVEPLLNAAGTDEQARVLRAAARARLSIWSEDPAERVKGIDVPTAAEDALPVHYVEWCLEAIRTGRLSSAARQFMQSQFLQAQQAPRFVVLKHQLACELHCCFGETEGALFHMRAAVEAGLSDRNWVKRCPALSRLQPETELNELRSRITSRAELVLAALKAG